MPGSLVDVLFPEGERDYALFLETAFTGSRAIREDVSMSAEAAEKLWPKRGAVRLPYFDPYDPPNVVRLSESRGRAIVLGQLVAGSRMVALLDTRLALPNLTPEFVMYDPATAEASVWEGPVGEGVRVDTTVAIDSSGMMDGGPVDWRSVLQCPDYRDRLARHLGADVAVFGAIRSPVWGDRTPGRRRGRNLPTIWELEYGDAGESGREEREAGRSANFLLSCWGRSGELRAFTMPSHDYLRACRAKARPPAEQGAAAARAALAGTGDASAEPGRTESDGDGDDDDGGGGDRDEDEDHDGDRHPSTAWSRRKLAACPMSDCSFCSQVPSLVAAERRLPCLEEAGSDETAPLFDMFRADRHLSATQLVETSALTRAFPDLERKVWESRTSSLASFDVEALTVCSRAPRPASVDVVASHAESEGEMVIGRQVPFMCALSYHRPDGSSSSLEAEVFQVGTRSGVPSNTEIYDMVRRLMDRVFDLQARSEERKRELFAPELELLQQVIERHDDAGDGGRAGDARPRRFEATLLGKLRPMLVREVSRLWLAAHGGYRYDVPILARYLFRYARERGVKVNMVKSGARYKLLEVGPVCIFDTMNLFAVPASLDRCSRNVGITDLPKGFFPHSFFSCMERVVSPLRPHEIPPYESSHFDKMNAPGVKMCTRDEHAEFRDRLSAGTPAAALYREYIEVDARLCLRLAAKVRELVWELFRVDYLDSPSITVSSLFFRHSTLFLPFASGQPGFQACRPGTALAILENAIAGGLCVRMVDGRERGDPLAPNDPASETVDNVGCLDFNSLYPSVLRQGELLPVGCSAVYTRGPFPDSPFHLTSQGRTYGGQNFVMCVLFHAKAILDGLTVKSAHHAGLAGEVFVAAGCQPDCAVFALDPRTGESHAKFFFYDGYVHHFMDEGEAVRVHQRDCARYDGTNGFETSVKHGKTARHTQEMRRTLERTFKGLYDVVSVVRESWCAFHNRVEVGGRTYRDPYAALTAVSLELPELQVPAEFPRELDLDTLNSYLDTGDARPDSHVFTGFITLDAHVPEEKRDPHFGLCIAKKFVDRDQLCSPEFADEMRRRFAAEMPGKDPDDCAERYLRREVLSGRKLLATHSFENATVSLAYYNFLRKEAGLVIDRAHHLLLYGIRRRASVDCHATAKFVDRLLRVRDALVRKVNELGDDPAHAELRLRLTSLAAMIKVAANSIYGKCLFIKRETLKLRTSDELCRAVKRGREWLGKVKTLEVIATDVGEDGHFHNTFLAKSEVERPTFSAVQLGASVLTNSKLALARGYLNLTRLWRRSAWRMCYADTDSYIVATSSRRWHDLENREVDADARARLRYSLFGQTLPEAAYSTNPERVRTPYRRAIKRGIRSGKLKIERDRFAKGVFVALKVYSLSKSDVGEEDTSKFKAVSARTSLDRELFQKLGEEQSNLMERRTDLRIKHGIAVVEATRKATSYRSRLNYKFRTVAPNETVAFA